VYRMAGIELPRDAAQQAEKGRRLSFIEEATPGDLAFFDNDQGNIIHVGILLASNHIIHASGKVRIDRIDHQGIHNNEIKGYSHQLRLITKILP
jgi:cell wall-associated NlpC family hydrolase